LTASGKGVNLLVSTRFARLLSQKTFHADSQPARSPAAEGEAEVFEVAGVG
jgi:hypothetical protein